MRFSTAALAVLAAATGAQAVITCAFKYKTQQCPAIGAACAPTDEFIADSGSRAGDSSYSSAYCKVQAGTNSSTWSGIVAAAPAFEQAYRSSCAMGNRYDCTHTDPTLMGHEHFPGLLECSGVRQCVMLAIQETGDPCSSSSECISGMCVNGVCQGRTLGQSCSPGGCAPGYYCEYARGTYTCQADTPSYGGCSSLGQCGSGNICNLASTQPLCTPLFSQPTGTRVNTADLCSSGFMDANNKCTDPAPASALGAVCDCASTPSTPGTICACAKDNQCRVREATFRTANIVATRKAARACFAAARAPDGTECSDPWTNVGAGTRSTDLGTCGYLKCHKEIIASYAALLDNEQLPNEYFDANMACAKQVFSAFYTAAKNTLVPCSLPDAWRASGWTCNTEAPAPPSGMSGGAKFGVAVAVLLPLGLLAWAGYLLWAGKAPAWLSNAAGAVSGGFSSLTSRASSVSFKTGGSGSYAQVGTAYTTTSSSGYGSGGYGSASSAASGSSSLVGSSSSGYQ